MQTGEAANGEGDRAVERDYLRGRRGGAVGGVGTVAMVAEAGDGSLSLSLSLSLLFFFVFFPAASSSSSSPPSLFSSLLSRFVSLLSSLFFVSPLPPLFL